MTSILAHVAPIDADKCSRIPGGEGREADQAHSLSGLLVSGLRLPLWTLATQTLQGVGCKIDRRRQLSTRSVKTKPLTY